MSNLFDLTPYMVDMIYELIPGVRRRGDKLNFRCPICGDGKKKTSHRGYFYLKQGTYWCWNGGCPANEKGFSGLQFLSILTHKSISEIKTQLIKRAGTFNTALNDENTNKKDINTLFNDLSIKKQQKQKIRLSLIKDEWIQPPSWVLSEINRRKIYSSPFIREGWQLYFDTKSKRLVIPWTKDYYQLRALTTTQQKKQGKYLFPPNIEKPIFGLDNIDTNFKYLFLLEGVFDAIFVKNGLAVGSLKLSNLQKQILENNYKDYKIVYFMDNQYKDESAKNETFKLIKDYPNINIFIWPQKLKSFKDVNETIIYDDNFIKLWSNETFLTNRIFNGLKARLALRG